MQDNETREKNGVEKAEIIRIDEGEIRSHVDQVVRGTVEETLNTLLEAEADALCGARDATSGLRTVWTLGRVTTSESSTRKRVRLNCQFRNYGRFRSRQR